MAFPTIVTETNSAQNSDVFDPTPHVASLPASLVAGNLLVVAVVIDGAAGTITRPSGWSDIVAAFSNGGNNVHGAAWYKVSDGSEGSTVSFLTSGSQRSVHKSWQISGHASSTNPPQGAGVGDGSTATLIADPPNETPTGGAKDYLWLAVGGKDRGDLTFDGFPASYTNTGEQNQSAADAAGVCIGWGRRALNAASENPAAFTFPTTNRNTVAMTLAVHPGAEGGGSIGSASGAVGTATSSAPAGTASSSRSCTITLKDIGGVPLDTVSRRFWTRTALQAAASDGGAGGLAVTCNALGVFNLTGLLVLAGSGWLTYKDAADDMTAHAVPVTFV